MYSIVVVAQFEGDEGRLDDLEDCLKQVLRLPGTF